MTFGSLFSGIGGIDLGLERAGWECRWQVENDEFCNRVLERHWPDVPRYHDIRDTGMSCLEPVDLIAGGFPCQDVSVAGRRAGIEGSRSGLWSEFARLVGELRPRCVLVENVPGLRTAGADRVLGDLEALGYTCWPLVVGARHLGAPHRRDRVWIVADAGITRLEGRRRLPVSAGPQQSVPTGRGDAKPLADADSRGLEEQRRSGLLDDKRTPLGDDAHRRHRWPSRPGEPQHDWEEPRTTQPALGRSADGVSRRLALRALGNSAVPQVAEVIGRAIMETVT